MSPNCPWLGAGANGTTGPQPQHPLAPAHDTSVQLHVNGSTVQPLSCAVGDGVGTVNDFVGDAGTPRAPVFLCEGAGKRRLLQTERQAEVLFTPKTLKTPLPAPPSSKKSDCGRENSQWRQSKREQK